MDTLFLFRLINDIALKMNLDLINVYEQLKKLSSTVIEPSKFGFNTFKTQ